MYVILLGDSVSGPLKIKIPANRRGFLIITREPFQKQVAYTSRWR